MSLVSYGSSDEDSETEELVSSSSIKKKEPKKIYIPSLKEFVEENEDEKKKVKPKIGSSLLSLLPAPKSSITLSKPGFTPYVFSKKKDIKKKISAEVQIQESTNKKSIKQTEIVETSMKSDSEHKEDCEDTEKIDFFSLGNKPSTDEINLKFKNDTLDPLTNNKSILLTDKLSSVSHQVLSEASFKSDSSISGKDEISSTIYSEDFSTNEAAATDSCDLKDEEPKGEAYMALDFEKDKKFLKLKGKNKMEEINIIDVNADDQLTGRNELLMRSLTEEKVHRPLKRRHDMPTQQQKRKHQITYLAFRAKERELDLKNQWSLNSRTRRETQAKYGF